MCIFKFTSCPPSPYSYWPSSKTCLLSFVMSSLSCFLCKECLVVAGCGSSSSCSWWWPTSSLQWTWFQRWCLDRWVWWMTYFHWWLCWVMWLTCTDKTSHRGQHSCHVIIAELSSGIYKCTKGDYIHKRKTFVYNIYSMKIQMCKNKFRFKR